VFAAAVKDELDEILEKHTFWRSIHILSWMKKFVRNCKAKLAKTALQSGPLTRKEVHGETGRDRIFNEMKTVSLNAEDESKDCFQHMCHLERYLLRK
jgi:small-conductance mechanosensitive channel